MIDVISCPKRNFQGLIKQTVTKKTDLRVNFPPHLKHLSHSYYISWHFINSTDLTAFNKLLGAVSFHLLLILV